MFCSKKIRHLVVLLLSVSEFGLVLFYKDAIQQSLEILCYSFHIPFTDDQFMILLLSWFMAFISTLGNFLSIGDISKTLYNSAGLEFGELKYKIQYLMFFLAYIAASLSGPSALWKDLNSQSLEITLLSIYIVLGQIMVFSLQTNKRIYRSLDDLKKIAKFFSTSKIFRKKVIWGCFISLANVIFKSTIFYYIGTRFCELFTTNTSKLFLVGLSFATVGGYFVLSTQALDNLVESINSIEMYQQNGKSTAKAAYKSLYYKPTVLSLVISQGIFISTALSSISFGYSVFNVTTFEASNFNYHLGLYSLIFLIPGLISGSQYAAYIHNQVRDFLDKAKFILIHKLGRTIN